MELEEYMEKLPKPDIARKNIEKLFFELKMKRINAKLISIVNKFVIDYGKDSKALQIKGKTQKFETLYDFVNEENVNGLLKEAEDEYQAIEVCILYV